MELIDQTALITGGTAGIGLACARLLAREGTSVIITGRDAERGKAAAAAISGNVRFIQADLSDIESVKALVVDAGEVDILVNNAASFPAALTVHQEVASFEKTFDTNVRGTYPHLGCRVRSARGPGQQCRPRSHQNRRRRGGVGRHQRGTRSCVAVGPYRRTRRDRSRGALPRLATLEFHHRLDAARRRRRHRHLKTQERNDRCRKSMTPAGRTR